MTIHIEKTNSVFQKAAETLIVRLDKNSLDRKKTILFLSGGSVVKLYGYILNWLSGQKEPLIEFAQVDERFVPEAQNARSKIKDQKSKILNENINAEIIAQTGLWEVCAKKNIPYHIISQKGTLEQSANEYNQTVTMLFSEASEKIAVLGIGEDGHTAGLLPGYAYKWNTGKLVAGYENTGTYRARISLTPQAFSKLDYALVVATGFRKREVLSQLQRDKNELKVDKYPSLYLHTIPTLDLFTDQQI